MNYITNNSEDTGYYMIEDKVRYLYHIIHKKCIPEVKDLNTKSEGLSLLT